VIPLECFDNSTLQGVVSDIKTSRF